MSAQLPHVSDEDLHAFIDGALDDARAHAVAAALESDTALAARAAAFSTDKVRLQHLHANILSEPLPTAWTEMIARGAEPRRIIPFRLTRIPRAALALAASVVLMIGGWALYRAMPAGDDAIIGEVLAVHANTAPEVAAVVPGADAGATMSQVLGVPLKVPDLSKMGFTLAAIQVHDDVPGGRAMTLSYRDAGNRLFTLYLKPSPGTPRFDMLKRGETRICIWQDDVLSTIMVADISAAEMLRLASLAYAGLT